MSKHSLAKQVSVEGGESVVGREWLSLGEETDGMWEDGLGLESLKCRVSYEDATHIGGDCLFRNCS